MDAVKTMLRLKDVSVAFSRVMALIDVNLTVAKGEFVFLVGSTGAGKSTLLKLLTREVSARSGEVWVDGCDVGRLKASRVPALRRRMGIIPQDFGLLPNKRVWENVAYALRAIGVGRRQAHANALEALERVGLTRRIYAYPGELSGGEAQRVAIARAIANHPPLLIADEPTGNLDPDTSWEIMQILDLINSRGTTVLAATHDSLMVDRMRKRVVELDLGCVRRDEQQSLYACTV